MSAFRDAMRVQRINVMRQRMRRALQMLQLQEQMRQQHADRPPPDECFCLVCTIRRSGQLGAPLAITLGGRADDEDTAQSPAAPTATH